MGMERQGSSIPLGPLPFNILGTDERIFRPSDDVYSIGRRTDILRPSRSSVMNSSWTIPSTVGSFDAEKEESRVESHIGDLQMRLSNIVKEIKALSGEVYSYSFIYSYKAKERTTSVAVCEDEDFSVGEEQIHNVLDTSRESEPINPTINPTKEPDTAPNEVHTDVHVRRVLDMKSLTTWTEANPDPTIHILGMGAIGKYMAHSLASVHHPRPITLLMHRPLEMQQWHDEGAAIRLVRDGKVDIQTGFHVESSAPFRRRSLDQRFPGFGENLEHTAEPPTSIIQTLIVTTDGEITIPALRAIRHRIRPTTTILFIQDGLGIIERVNAEFFPSPHPRPSYILGNISHRFLPTEWKFSLIEAHPGCLTCSIIPQDFSSPTKVHGTTRWLPATRHLMVALKSTPDFNTKAYGPQTFYKTHLENLVVRCVIGPVATMFDCTNDLLLYNRAASAVWWPLLEELCQIIRAMPELAGRPRLEEDFWAPRIHRILVSILKKTGKNQDRMLQQIKNGRQTDIEYLNGYFSKRARELGIKCPTNDMLYQMVKGKQAAQSRKLNEYIPFSQP